MGEIARKPPEGYIELTGDEFTVTQAVGRLKPGQVSVYHRGYLPCDKDGNNRLKGIAKHIYWLGREEDEHGKKRPSQLELTQIKLGYRQYIYMATRKHTRLSAV